MDIYNPPIDGMTQSAYTASVNEPWEELHGTRTVMFISGQRKAAQRGLSSASDFTNATYVIVDGPTIKGLQRLRTFKSFADNWDAEGGRAPDKDTIDAASQVFSLLAMYSMPKVTLSSDGYPMFVFSGSQRGEVLMSSPNTINFYFHGDDAPFGDDVPFENGRLPDELVEHLQRTR